MSSYLELATSIVSNLADGALVVNRDLTCLAHNRAALHILGVRPRSFVAKLARTGSPFALCGYPDGDELAQRCIESKKVITLNEMSITAPDGRLLTVNLTFSPIVDPQSQDCLGVLYMFRDVTAESRMQRHYTDLLSQERARGDELERQVAERTRELQVALQEVRRLAWVDPLTGALNRRALGEVAHEAILRAKRHSRTVGFLLCDLDRFKLINDTYGHQAGDSVLVATVQALTRTLRQTDKVGRFGGEEFVVLLSEAARDKVAAIGERCREAISRIPINHLIPNARGPLTTSIGCALYPDHGETVDDVIGAADKALYRAKESGRNRVEMYSRGMQETSPGRALSGVIRVLIVHPERAAGVRYNKLLPQGYEVVLESSQEAAAVTCRNESFDVIIAAAVLPDGSGVELLRSTLPIHANAVRILIADKEDFSLVVEGTRVAHVDHVLLDSECATDLARSVEDALRWRSVMRDRVLNQGAASIRAGTPEQASKLDTLLQDEAMRFLYQPIIGVDSETIAGYEALCRPDPRLFDGPTQLLDAAVASGRLWELGRMMRRKIASRLDDLPEEASLFINLHPADLDDPNLLNGESFLVPHRVVLEITERSQIPDFRRCKESVSRLRQLGFSIAVDDLGSGYASLNVVALLEPQFIKIDIGLVSGIADQPHKAKLVRRIVEFAHDASIRVVAEGVERAEDAELVRELGCTLMQGYFIGMPGDDFE